MCFDHAKVARFVSECMKHIDGECYTNNDDLMPIGVSAYATQPNNNDLNEVDDGENAEIYETASS